jgi:hypothetical protein
MIAVDDDNGDDDDADERLKYLELYKCSIIVEKSRKADESRRRPKEL